MSSMKTRTKAIIAATAGLLVGGIGSGTFVGWAFMIIYQPEGLEALGAVVFGMLAAIVGAPVGCYIALRMAKIPHPGMTTVKAIVIAIGVWIGLGALSALLGSEATGSLYVFLAIAATAVPAYVLARQKGWFKKSWSR
jgi:hypothetical protein